MRRASRLAVRPRVFRTIILLVVINATAGIIVIAGSGGQVGSTERHVLETTGLLSLAALLLLPCVLAYEAGRLKPFVLIPWSGAACLFIGFGLAVCLVWADPTGDTLNRIAATFGVAGGGLAHVSLLALVGMRRAYAWLQILASTLTLMLTALLVSAFWTNLDEGGFEDWKVRLFAVLAILAAATSLLVPVVDRLARSQVEDAVTPSRASYCPNCAAVLTPERNAVRRMRRPVPNRVRRAGPGVKR